MSRSELPAFIVFDLDGTIVDSAEGIVSSFEATLGDFGRSVERSQLVTLIGPPLHDSFLRLGFGPEQLDEVLARYRTHYGRDGVTRCRLYDGVPELLDRVAARDVPMSIATAKRADFAAQILDALGLAQYFAVVVGAAVDGRRSAKASIVAQAITDLSPKSPRGWMVGDRRYDVEAAHANHLLAFGVTWGYGTVGELRDAGADRLFNRPSELNALLDHLAVRSRQRDRS